MKKGIIIGVAISSFVFSGIAIAKVVTAPDTLQVVDSLYVPHVVYLTKVYDSNNGAVCYLGSGYSNSVVSVSCIK